MPMQVNISFEERMTITLSNIDPLNNYLKINDNPCINFDLHQICANERRLLI